ncbi:hypothetical protein Y032_0662g1295 [Ancylostoma ceylanicum]|uniref:Uncharacterized protein n=1 Tax=Ancylostoma ceylanicum TaxID=53326 RepID=A0A016WJ70_9BILA|nr:hypothetical protein Y032_0662g1295 [Ancylostoma ceylanicum]
MTFPSPKTSKHENFSNIKVSVNAFFDKSLKSGASKKNGVVLINRGTCDTKISRNVFPYFGVTNGSIVCSTRDNSPGEIRDKEKFRGCDVILQPENVTVIQKHSCNGIRAPLGIVVICTLVLF